MGAGGRPAYGMREKCFQRSFGIGDFGGVLVECYLSLPHIRSWQIFRFFVEKLSLFAFLAYQAAIVAYRRKNKNAATGDRTAGRRDARRDAKPFRHTPVRPSLADHTNKRAQPRGSAPAPIQKAKKRKSRHRGSNRRAPRCQARR